MITTAPMYGGLVMHCSTRGWPWKRPKWNAMDNEGGVWELRGEGYNWWRLMWWATWVRITPMNPRPYHRFTMTSDQL